jgi:hypothetical protein
LVEDLGEEFVDGDFFFFEEVADRRLVPGGKR